MSGGKRQIDLAKGTKIPAGEDDDPDLSPSKAPKMAGGSAGGPALGVTAQELQQMLAVQTSQLLETQESMVARVVSRFEKIVDDKLEANSGRVDVVEKRLADLEEKLDKALATEGGRSAAGGGEDLARRQRTLVFGGWNRDTRRSELLAELKQALSSLQVTRFMDDDPFTTGVRRSIALAGFKQRQGETFEDMRGRMQLVCRAFFESEVTGKQGKRLWCNWSKSRLERAHSGHAAMVKRVIGEVDRVKLLELEMEWGQGSVWTHSNLVASSREPPPPGIPSSDLIYKETLAGKAWINVAQAATDLRIDRGVLQQKLEAA